MEREELLIKVNSVLFLKQSCVRKVKLDIQHVQLDKKRFYIEVHLDVET